MTALLAVYTSAAVISSQPIQEKSVEAANPSQNDDLENAENRGFGYYPGFGGGYNPYYRGFRGGGFGGFGGGFNGGFGGGYNPYYRGGFGRRGFGGGFGYPGFGGGFFG